MKRRLIIFGTPAALLVGVITILWIHFEWAPPRSILEYGLPSSGEPTGRTKVIAGIEFEEIAPGYRWIKGAMEDGHLLDNWRRLGRKLIGSDPLDGILYDEFNFVRVDLPADWSPPRWSQTRWLEMPRAFWITAEPIDWFDISNRSLMGGGGVGDAERRSAAGWLERFEHLEGGGEVRFCSFEEWEFALPGRRSGKPVDHLEAVAGEDGGTLDLVSWFQYGPGALKLPGSTKVAFHLVWRPPDDSE